MRTDTIVDSSARRQCISNQSTSTTCVYRAVYRAFVVCLRVLVKSCNRANGLPSVFVLSTSQTACLALIFVVAAVETCVMS